MGRWHKVEKVEGGSFRSRGTQTPDRSRATPRRALRSPASLVPRPPSIGRSLPGLHPVLGPDPIPVPPPSVPHSSPLASLQAWGASPPRGVRPGPPPSAATPPVSGIQPRAGVGSRSSWEPRGLVQGFQHHEGAGLLLLVEPAARCDLSPASSLHAPVCLTDLVLPSTT